MPPIARWREKVESWNRLAPNCACGCGTKLCISSQRDLYRLRKFVPGHSSMRYKEGGLHYG
jgi:hypothetical protein